MSRTKWAAVAAAVIALGAAGCGTGAADTGAAAGAKPASPRPEGTGPLTKKVVRGDVDASVADAGVPDNAPEFGQLDQEGASKDSVRSCAVAFKGFGTKATRVDLTRFEAVLSELRERDWRQRPKGADMGSQTVVVLKQRGWTLVASHMDMPDEGVITLWAYDDACMKKYGEDVDRPA